MKIFKYVGCAFKAIPFWFKTKVWIPHVYDGEKQKKTTVDVAVTNRDFRVVKNLEHKENERLYKNVTLVEDTCKYCGHKSYRWERCYDLEAINDR